MKKILTFLTVTVLLCSLTACSGKAEQTTDTKNTATVKTEQTDDTNNNSTPETEQSDDTKSDSAMETTPIDYTMFCGNYSDTETVEGPCYTVSIISVDNTTKAIDISISYVGPNSSPLYSTETIHASITSDHTVQFEWTDSWMNQGVGTLILNPDDPSTVQLMMTVTEEAEVNRATLSTGDQYKTLMRRQQSKKERHMIDLNYLK